MADVKRALLRRAVPSRGHAHEAGRARSSSASCARSAAATRCWTRGQHHRGRHRRACARRSARTRCCSGLSGGVDSSVVAALLHKAIGDQLVCVFVDTGLLRLDEGDQVMSIFAEAPGRARDPRRTPRARSSRRSRASPIRRRKRKIIGRMFVEVFDDEAAQARGRALARAGHDLSGRDRVGGRARRARRT